MMLSLRFGILAALSLAAAACGSNPETVAPSEPTASGLTTTEFSPATVSSSTTEPSADSTPTLPPAVESASLAIAPATLGQLRLRWNVNFPTGFFDSGCNPKEGECTLYTNVAGYAFSWDGNVLAVAVCFGTRTVDRSQPSQDDMGCSAESAIVLYDAATGEERGRLAPAALPLALAFHPDGIFLAAGLANSEIELWDLSTGDRADTLTGSPKYFGAYPLAFTPDGNLLISGSGNSSQLQLWDWRAAALPTTIEEAYGIGISPDSGSLVTLHFVNQADAILRVYDLAQTDRFSEIPIEYAPTEFSFNPVNGWLSSVIVGSNPGPASFWDPVSNTIAATLDFMREWEQAHVLYDLNSGGFTPGGYFLLERFGQLTAPEAQPEATGLSEPLWACGFALADTEANQIFFTPAMLYDVCTGPEYMYDMGLSGLEPQILSPDGRFIAADDAFGNLRVWGIDASLPGIPPECSGECLTP